MENNQNNEIPNIGPHQYNPVNSDRDSQRTQIRPAYEYNARKQILKLPMSLEFLKKESESEMLEDGIG